MKPFSDYITEARRQPKMPTDMESTSKAYDRLHVLITKNVVTVVQEKGDYYLKWDDSHSKIFLVSGQSPSTKYKNLDDAFKAFYESGRMNTIRSFTDLPTSLEKVIKDWQKMWKKEYDEIKNRETKQYMDRLGM